MSLKNKFGFKLVYTFENSHKNVLIPGKNVRFWPGPGTLNLLDFGRGQDRGPDRSLLTIVGQDGSY